MNVNLISSVLLFVLALAVLIGMLVLAGLQLRASRLHYCWSSEREDAREREVKRLAETLVHAVGRPESERATAHYYPKVACAQCPCCPNVVTDVGLGQHVTPEKDPHPS